VEHYDFIALGGGNAGLGASKGVRAAGKKVALIDPMPIGGLCGLRGCNPKKVLVRATEVLHIVKEAGEHGIGPIDAPIDWRAVIERKQRFTDPVTPRTEKSLRDAGIDYIRAAPRFIAPDRLDVEGRTLSFDGLAIATGSAPRRLSFPGAQYVSSSDDLLELETIPRHLVIIGAGVVGFEFAHVFARLGSSVHMLVRGREILKGREADLVSRLVQHTRTLGVTFHEEVEVQAVTEKQGAYEVELSNTTCLAADFVLNASGRPANLEGLALEKANVKYNAHGIEVTDYLRSPGDPRVFAGGDAHGKRELSPVASYEGAIIAHNFLHGDERRADYSAIPSAIFTIPPFASVGVTEDAARKERDIDVAAQDMSEWLVFAIAGEKPAHGKVIFEKSTGRVLGAHLFGPAADEHIHVFAMAMRYGITRQQLREMIYVYPSLGSAMGNLIAA
jgi:glutathione reductase (NADPH)